MRITRSNYKDICQCTYDTDGNLTSLVIPRCVTSIPQRIFANQRHLHTVHMLCNIKVIPIGMFDGCIALAYVTLPNRLLEINYKAFLNCKSLKYITLPNTLRKIGSSVFKGTGLVSIDIPDSTTSMGNGVFEHCESLTYVRLPNTLKSMDYWLFNRCTNLTSLIIPSSVEYIGMNVLSYTNIQSLVIPPSVKYIEISALTDSSIKSLTILSPRIHIARYAIINCPQLQHLVLPNTPIDISDLAFAYCPGVYDTLEEHGYCTDNYYIPYSCSISL